jgi:carbonic anhydrase
MKQIVLNILIAAFLSAVFLACNQIKHQPNETTTTHEEAHWSYEGETSPEHWAEIEKNSSCDSKYQSPINIIDIDASADETGWMELKIAYSPKTLIHDVLNNGHTIQFDFELGDSIFFHEKNYPLRQIHFHEPAEHTINGVRYPIEIHLVHISPENEYTVLGIVGEEGENSEPFDFLESFLPVQEGETKIIDRSFNLNELLPGDDRSFYHYHGSLTTPPCSEDVNWIVLKKPVILSVDQVRLLKELMPLNNYRNEQPLNDRVVWKNFL